MGMRSKTSIRSLIRRRAQVTIAGKITSKTEQRAFLTRRGHHERIEELEQTLFQLQDEIGARRRLPPDVRVLSLRDNAAQQ